MSPNSEKKHYDVVIIGGGPAGSAAGALLAAKGKKILILEKEKFPRFHVGESLIPYGNDVLKELGLWEKIEQAGFMPKWGAEFCVGNGSKFKQFWFGSSLGESYAKTFQVERGKFDQILLDNAQIAGCEVKQESLAKQVIFNENEVNITYNQNNLSHSISARWLLDASGRDSFLGKHLKISKYETQSDKRIAIYAHFENVFRNEGQAAGHIIIVRIANGWFWFIPLTETKTSVGYVQSLKDFKASGLNPEESFRAIVQQETELLARLKNAKHIGEFHVTSDYSYRFESFAHPRALMVGDAAGFVDPIFSSGVMMALKSAKLATKTILKAEAKNQMLSVSARRSYTHRVRKMMEIYVNMINAFYDPNSFEVFMNPISRLQIPKAVLAVLGGNTNFTFSLWWRLKFFYLVCYFQRFLPLAPRLNFSQISSS